MGLAQRGAVAGRPLAGKPGISPNNSAKSGPFITKPGPKGPLFLYHSWQANLRILEIEEIKSIPYTPISHPFVERLIGTIRREYLDHIFCWNAHDLARKLEAFRKYYNQNRVHQSLAGNTPVVVSGISQIQCADLSNYS